MNFDIETFSKSYIIEIIKYLTQKSNIFKLIQDANDNLQNKYENQQFVNLRANYYYKMSIIINDLVDINLDDKFQFLILIKKIIKFIKTENPELSIKFKYLIHLLSFLTKFTKIYLQLLIDFKFNNTLITKIVFDQFTELSQFQQNELISSSFIKYFESNEKKDLNTQEYPEQGEQEDQYFQIYINKEIEESFTKYFIFIQEPQIRIKKIYSKS
ncbi:unnamed protein product [Paramecium primaurelia]|uniref:Uncharacterized protein n=1 Tax=Paramecium primaurelia TaxID=5886 RepID=A0A8S1JNP7_PARPR|nr:unnamed protein product [Paramecium primaurelia]